MSDEHDPLSDEDTEVLPWITAIQAFTRYQKTAPLLKELVKSGKLRTKKINGRDMYSTEDLDELPNGGKADASAAETTMADLIRVATSMVAVAQKHGETMFDKYMGAFDHLLERDAKLIEKQNEHILELEKQAMAMREATEKVFTLEHERKMVEVREERTKAMQTKALDTLAKTLGPWVASKLGGVIPGMPTAPAGGAAGGDPRFAQLGEAVVGMVASMTDEAFAKLLTTIPEPEGQYLSMIREGMKSA